jgi:ubiquinone/menaquinone biosynthesis C-methylase UbiE
VPDPVAQVGSDFDRVANEYDSTEAIFSGPIAARLVRDAGVRPGDRVLDVGCGTGSALIRAAVEAGPDGHVTGVDASPRMIDQARARAAAAGVNVTLVTGDATDPPGADAAFDKVIASLVFYLLPDPERAAGAWLRLLRPGGVTAFSWNVGEDPVWERVYGAVDGYVPPGFPTFTAMLRHWPLTSAADLERMLSGCGYTDVATTTADLRVRYASPDQWWDSGWTRARRISWQHIPDDRRPAAREEVLGLLEGLRDPADGSVTRTVRFGWTVGYRSEGA